MSTSALLSRPAVRVLPLQRWHVPLLAGIAVLAFAARLQMAIRGGGLLSIGAYDDGVHYAAAASLIDGRLPYRDFLFLQPPAMVLAATPFAEIGRLFGDPTALRLFRIAFQLVGAANAVLVALVLRRWGTAAMVTGGIGYALFFPAVYDERTALLEPMGTAGILLGILLSGRFARPAAQVVAGLALGVAVGFKIWYVVPAVIVLVFAHGRLRVLAGAVVAGLAIYLPFFAAAPARMWGDVVLAQAGRGVSKDQDFLTRARVLLGVAGVHQHSPVPGMEGATLTIVALVLVGLAVLVALATPGARVFGVLLVAEGAVAELSPSFFAHYAALTASALMLLLGLVVGRIVPLLRRRLLRGVAVGVVLAGVVGLNAVHDLDPVDVRPPAALRADAQRIKGCIVSDDPTLLAVMDVLTRDLEEGCPLRPDTGGYSFGPERLVVDGTMVSRGNNAGYQRSTVDYLLASDAFIRWRRNTALNAASLARLREQPELASAGGFTIRQGLGR